MRRIYFTEEDSKYCYKNTKVLINKYDIKDFDTLKKVEKEISAVKIAVLMFSCAVKNVFDFEYFKEIHKFIFEELYEWAGQIRTLRLEKDGFPFAFPENIEPESKRIFSELKTENYLQGYDYDIFTKRMAYFMTELNVLHPFREGNGRVNRVFFRKLAEMNGYEINFEYVKKEEYLEAIIKSSVFCEINFLEKLLERCLKKL